MSHCGARSNGGAAFIRVLSWDRLAQFLADQPPCVVAMDACATPHHWGRVALGHDLDAQLFPAKDVKRQWRDFADAAAILGAASLPSMGFVAVKQAERQGRAVTFQTQQCFLRQRTPLINALRARVGSVATEPRSSDSCHSWVYAIIMLCAVPTIA